jgi:hypothetical protein
MFRNTALKATHSNMLRGVASSTSRRAFHLTSTARSASKTSTFGLTSRRPLAVVDRAFNGARLYASSAEGNAPGVVSNITNLLIVFAIEKMIFLREIAKTIPHTATRLTRRRELFL